MLVYRRDLIRWFVDH